MSNAYNDKVHRINALSNELDAIYHAAARKLGIADSELIVMYEIYDSEGSCLLNAISKKNGISKQTVNSAIRRMEEQGIVYLEPYLGKAKRVCLTEKGRAYIAGTAQRVFEAECAVFADWTQTEIDTYLALLEKFNVSIREQIEKW